MAAYGADPAALDALAKSMATTARTLEQIGAEIGGRVSHAPWRGAQADAFRQRWISTYYPALRAAHSELASASTELAKNAHDQTAASSAGGGLTSTLPGSGSNGSSAVDALLHDLFFGVVPPTLDLVGEILDGIKDAGPEIKSLGLALSGVGWVFSLHDFVEDALTPQNFQGVHVIADGLELAGSTATIVGTVMLLPPATPVGATVIVVGKVAGAVGTGVNMTIDFWDTGGGREMWNTAAPWVEHQLDAAGREAWDVAYSGASHAASGAEHVAEGAWHLATGWL